MKYEETYRAKFIDRPNRFIAHVALNGKEETVHVKNTGRCRELLRPEAEVILCYSGNPSRKTAYDLIAVEKPGIGMVNIDRQAPNQVVKEWLQEQAFDLVRPEYRYGDSRMDFYMEKEHQRYLMEVKGCTLERDGIGYFPDAPTERGVKHLRELTKAVSEAVKIPVIASGGAGTMEHFYDALTKGGADAALAASLFHYKELEICQVKQYLQSRGVSVRL